MHLFAYCMAARGRCVLTVCVESQCFLPIVCSFALLVLLPRPKAESRWNVKQSNRFVLPCISALSAHVACIQMLDGHTGLDTFSANLFVEPRKLYLEPYNVLQHICLFISSFRSSPGVNNAAIMNVLVSDKKKSNGIAYLSERRGEKTSEKCRPL